jgi:glycine/sarcosine N-methyltransferase
MSSLKDSHDFYDKLAACFDVMTDWEARLAFEGPWLRALLERCGAHSVLDAACGTGGHAIAFANWGLDVVGMDASTEMIARARRKTTTARFVVAPLGKMARHLAGPVDAVMCLGNALPHLIEPEALAEALADMRRCLRQDGLLVLHNLNYDLRWWRRPRFFDAQSGIVEGRERIIWRLADYHDDTGLITFHMALFSKDPAGKWSVEVISTPQRPLFAAALKEALAGASFALQDMHGNLQGLPFAPKESPDLVMVAKAA